MNKPQFTQNINYLHTFLKEYCSEPIFTETIINYLKYQYQYDKQINILLDTNCDWNTFIHKYKDSYNGRNSLKLTIKIKIDNIRLIDIYLNYQTKLIDVYFYVFNKNADTYSFLGDALDLNNKEAITFDDFIVADIIN